MSCIVIVLLFYVHGKHLRSCRDGQLTYPYFSWAGLGIGVVCCFFFFFDVVVIVVDFLGGGGGVSLLYLRSIYPFPLFFFFFFLFFSRFLFSCFWLTALYQKENS